VDEKISEKKLYRLRGILAMKVYRRAKRMDINFTPYWRLPFDIIRKREKVFKRARLLGHREGKN
jgi:hypothetical protein